jgi:Na+/proline symporter
MDLNSKLYGLLSKPMVNGVILLILLAISYGVSTKGMYDFKKLFGFMVFYHVLTLVLALMLNKANAKYGCIGGFVIGIGLSVFLWMKFGKGAKIKTD